MKRRLFTSLMVGLTLAAVLPGLASAAEGNPGRPGQYELAYIDLNALSGFCDSAYVDPVGGNTYIQGTGEVRVVENNNGAHAVCKVTDTSGIYETNAEVAYSDFCRVLTAEGVWTGTGQVTAAANHGLDPGGTAIFRCDLDTFTPNP